MTIPQPPEQPQDPNLPPVPPVPPVPTEPYAAQPVEPQPYGQAPQQAPQQAYGQPAQYAQQPYGQPGQPQYGQQPYPQQAPTETLAIIGLVTGIIFWPAGIIINPIALSKIKKTGNGGRGFAIAGLILSIVGAISSIIAIVVTIISIATSAAIIGTAVGELDEEYGQVGETSETIQVGETGVTESGIAYTVNGSECGIASVGSEEDFTLTEAAGEYCRVDITMMNQGTEAAYFLASDATGFIADAEYTADSLATTYAAISEGNDETFTTEVNPGNSVTAGVYFDVPAGTQLDRVELASLSNFLDAGIEVIL